ncbi:DUF433 domain-containing protein [Mesorhizobium australicum]|uniref:Uncharacterized conserved protein, DUF433 family n=1 Tax=Mesorhizobium australicum TaxID=536018 RepID=A0A1X7NPD1_9HYPH|nr:DUF433 domain-containing protein [Mesorhizobium australicum]SMH39861.1 Uncharacterized conserved protein, DUF433 family [Mesorhizobium australicum]
MKISDVLSSDPEIVSGAVVFKGTRVPVAGLFEYLRAGDTLDEFLLDFPTVEREQVEAVIQLAGEDVEQLILKQAA